MWPFEVLGKGSKVGTSKLSLFFRQGVAVIIIVVIVSITIDANRARVICSTGVAYDDRGVFCFRHLE